MSRAIVVAFFFLPIFWFCDLCGTIDWALAHLQAADTPASSDSSLTGTASFTGMVFDTASLNTPKYDPSAVWLEGTSHTIAALVAREKEGSGSLSNRLHDLQTALKLVNTCEIAQAQLGAWQTVNGKAIPLGKALSPAPVSWTLVSAIPTAFQNTLVAGIASPREPFPAELLFLTFRVAPF